MAKDGNVYIISASPNISADLDKKTWIRKHLSNVPNKNIVLCRIGENKARVIERKVNITINENCFLLDDYTKNLTEWEEKGGKGIKRITSVADNSRGLWKGLICKDLKKICEVF